MAETILDLSTAIDSLRSKYWLNTNIQTRSFYAFQDLLSGIQAGCTSISDLKTFIGNQYPIREKFLRLKYDHIPARNEINVSVDRPMTFRVYNPDPAFGIDITTFKVRLNEGIWYRYGDTRFTFTKVNYREYLIYFNPPKLTYDRQIMAELYCEDHLNNPGIKLEIL